MAVLTGASYLPWAEEPLREGLQPDRFQASVFEVDVSGALFGGSVAVFESSRTDADNDEDVPVFGPENESNTTSRSATFERGGQKAYRAEGELWREEWIEPGDRSVSVRGDKPEEEFFYSVDAAGSRLSGSALNSEDVGRYLWFRPAVITALLQFRGADLHWYTEQTGSVKCSPDYATHFGVNREGLINVYAYDIAKLPHWQQRVWSGHNAAPEGQVSSELLDSQQRCRPASTKAPEAELQRLLTELNAAFLNHHGVAIFRVHNSAEAILKRVHRFRSLDAAGVLALAKDIARPNVDVGRIERQLLADCRGPQPYHQ